MTKRFIVETVEITDCDTDESRIAKVITDKEEIYSYDDLYEISDLLNEQQATINKLKSDIEETEISIKLFEDDVNRLSKENEQLRRQNKALKENSLVDAYFKYIGVKE